MDSMPRLTPTSFIVLGLLEEEEGTPYELTARAALSVGNFWSVPRSALYAEPDRLVGGGYLEREQEPDGLRRKTYRLTEKGRGALDAWRAAPSGGLPELRDESLLKLFFGADPRVIAGVQRDAHRDKLAEYERIRELCGEEPRGQLQALEAGIAHEREFIRFWSELAGD
jgi:PadR family transcriptional regulator, regulatory protein AphA